MVRLETGSGALIEQGEISSRSIGLRDTWVRYAFRQPRRIRAGQPFSLSSLRTATCLAIIGSSPFSKASGPLRGSEPLPAGTAQVNEGNGWQRAFPGFDADYQLYFVGRR